MSDWTPEKVRALRLSYGESQDDFADRARVTPTTLRNWESGRITPSGTASYVLDDLEERMPAYLEERAKSAAPRPNGRRKQAV